MVVTYEAGYQQLGDDIPQAIHHVPESEKARWNHIENLDSFFTKIYQYHQRHGFLCIMLQELSLQFQFVFVAVLITYMIHGVNLPIMAGEKSKLALWDIFLPVSACIANFGIYSWVYAFFAILFLCQRLIKVSCNLLKFYEVKAFFNVALNIEDDDLENVTWYHVQKRIQEVQIEQQMCIHKRELSELDIYHRILRFTNYMVAMVNKGLLPPKFRFPFLGDCVFFSYGLKFNIEMLLFWGPTSPFKNNWHLKEDYKKIGKRKELSGYLSRYICYVALANIILCPLILLYSIFYSFFYYAEIVNKLHLNWDIEWFKNETYKLKVDARGDALIQCIKNAAGVIKGRYETIRRVLRRDPSVFGTRQWSLYAKYYLRHFNELDHELKARLNRAYRPASKYLNTFSNPILTVIAKFCAFVSGSLIAVLFGLTLYDQELLIAEHIGLALSSLGILFAACRVLIPNENLVWLPEPLLTSVLAHVHYLPSDWRGNAHTANVRTDFEHLFQYKAVFLLMEIVSPIVTPIVLLTHLRPRSLEIVDFFRSFTVEVDGVGDVCTFAQMDIRTHGDPNWSHIKGNKPETTIDQSTQAEEGKIEMSLMHFALTNPEWVPPGVSKDFVLNVKEESTKLIMADPLLHSSSNLGVPWTSTYNLQQMSLLGQTTASMLARGVAFNVSRTEGAPFEQQFCNMTPSLGASVFGKELATLDLYEAAPIAMNSHFLFIHQLHQREVEQQQTTRTPHHHGSIAVPSTSTVIDLSNVAGCSEMLPLLGSPSRYT